MGKAKAANKGSPDKKQRRQRKKKDKNAPKRPCTAFLYYVQDQRFKGEHKDLKVSEFTKQCGARWKTLTDHQKTDFFSSANNDRKRYNNEMKNYKPAPDSGIKVAPVKDPNKPKKPMTPFLLYVGSIRKKLVQEGYSNKEVLSQAGERWKVITDEEKAPLLKEAAKLKQAYEKAMLVYNAEKNKPVSPQVKAAAQKNGKESEDESDEDDEESEEEDDDDDDDDDMESDDE